MNLSLLNTIVFLLGLLAVPLMLLVAGHRLRRRSHAVQRAFWGAVSGYCVAAIISLAAGMIPPEGWLPENTFRGVTGVWLPLVLPALCAAVAVVRAR